MLVKINESMAEDKFKDPTINKDAALWNDTRPHYNVGHVVPERDVKFEVIKGHEDHGPQPILVWNGKRLRPRAEMIVFNDKTGEILVRDNPSYKNSNVPFELPGGGLMEGKSFLETAIIEVKQEVRIEVKDAWDSHIYYINQSPDGTEQEWTTWGDYSQICCGICDGIYAGEIDDQDKDEDMARDAKWVRIEEVNLTPAHEEAIREYKRFLYSRGNSGYHVVKEAVIDSSTIRSFEDLKYKKILHSSLCEFLNRMKLTFDPYVYHSRYMRWPEEVFDTKMCNCVEISILLKYYYDSIRKPAIAAIIVSADSRLAAAGEECVNEAHMILLIRYKNSLIVWTMSDSGRVMFFDYGDMNIDDVLANLASNYNRIVASSLSRLDAQYAVPVYSKLDNRDWVIINNFYGSKIYQDDLLKKTSHPDQLNRRLGIRTLLADNRSKNKWSFYDKKNSNTLNLFIKELLKQKRNGEIK